MTGSARWLVGDRTAVLVEVAEGRVPVVREWGPAPLDDAATAATAAVRALTPAQTNSSVDTRIDLSLLPAQAVGFQGSPGLRGAFVDGTGWAPSPTSVDTTIAGRSLVTHVRDDRAGLRVDVVLAIDVHDVVTVQAAVTNLRGDAEGSDPLDGLPAATPGLGRSGGGLPSPDDYRLDALRLTIPVPDPAREVLDFQGRWIREAHPQRHAWGTGRVERVNVRGRTSQEDWPTMLVGEPGFGEESGRVWGIHLGWSGNHELRADRTADGFAYLQAAEHLHPGEVLLRPGHTYVTPVLYGAASTTGLNGISDAFHGHLRARPTHPRRLRPVTLNTWEAVYMDHDRRRLDDLVEVAAEVGVERFVLDDGWFTERDDDTAGLGDWVVDRRKHPEGLRALGDRVRAAGMEFGVWVEPEMVNPGSDLYRNDPSVGLAAPDTPLFRHQQVLDVARDDIRSHVKGRLEAMLDDARPAFLKWDLNRDHVVAEHDGRAASHAQVVAAWALLEELGESHPELEIESCASGGGRIDLGVLERTSRVWASDCNDPLERQRIQRGLSYLLPPELVGAHVGPPMAHTTGRTATLAFRLATAFFGHFGVEWDVTTTGEDDRATIARVIALHKQWRDVLHGGRVVRVDHPDEHAMVHGVVTGERALFCHAQLATSAWARPAAVRCPGLDPERTYRVDLVDDLTDDPGPSTIAPAWYADGQVDLPGAHLADHGVALHVHDPERATVLALEALDH